MTRQKVNQSNQQSKNQAPLVSGVLQRAAVRAVADKEGEATQEVESGRLSQSRFVHDFSQVPIGRGGLHKEVSDTPNQTGLPDNLKAGIENLSGYSLDDVRVHYNSPKPAQLQALAYTQGTDIHVALGQEQHLPHEAWHVVQQMQGKVKPTMQMKGEQINDDEGLEIEADVMGEKANKMEQGLTKSYNLKHRASNHDLKFTQPIQGFFIYSNGKKMSETAKQKIIALWRSNNGFGSFVKQAMDAKTSAIFEEWFEQNLPNESIREQIKQIAIDDTKFTEESATAETNIPVTLDDVLIYNKETIEHLKKIKNLASLQEKIQQAIEITIYNKDIIDVRKTIIEYWEMYCEENKGDVLFNLLKTINDVAESYQESESALSYIKDILDNISTSVKTAKEKETDEITERDLTGFSEAEELGEMDNLFYSYSEKSTYSYKKDLPIKGVSDKIKKKLIAFIQKMINNAGGDFDQRNPDYYKKLETLVRIVKEIKSFLVSNAKKEEIEILGQSGIIAGLVNIQTTNAVGFDCHEKMMANMILRLS